MAKRFGWDYLTDVFRMPLLLQTMYNSTVVKITLSPIPDPHPHTIHPIPPEFIPVLVCDFSLNNYHTIVVSWSGRETLQRATSAKC